jgi:hypothetical protein
VYESQIFPICAKSGGGGGGSGTVTLINTDANLTGGPITTTGNIGLAANISFYRGNVTYTNGNVGTSVVNINTLNAAVNGLNAQIPANYASTANLSVTYANGTPGSWRYFNSDSQWCFVFR